MKRAQVVLTCTIGRAMGRHAIRCILISLVIPLVLLLAACGATGVGPGPDSTPPASESQLAPWSDLMSLAQYEAVKLDKGATLTEIEAFGLYCKGGNTKPMTTHFVFERPSGVALSVDLSNSNPPKLIRSSTYAGESSAMSAGLLEKIKALANDIKIGPQEVCSQTIAEGQAYAPQPVVSLFLHEFENDVQQNPDLDNQWQASYYNQSTHTELRFVVSAQNGTILSRIKNFVAITPTPSY